jgi:predicted dithiol-disulfide oxidoreductase (DUF899 family)
MQHNRIVSRDEWVAARKQLLVREKQLTHLRDEISAERRALPWVKVEKRYTFTAPDGKKTLADLFAGRSQLVIYHFMLGPGWKDGCIGCSFLSDHINGALVHLEHHDVSLVAVSRAPIGEIEAYRRRMGWGFKWVSSNGTDFNHDYHVSFSKDELAKGKVYYNYTKIDPGIDELSGMSVFYKDENGDIFHTYSSYARGGEDLLTTYMVLDRTPKGRDENGPHHNLMDWVRRHDEYDDVEGTPGCHGS